MGAVEVGRTTVVGQVEAIVFDHTAVRGDVVEGLGPGVREVAGDPFAETAAEIGLQAVIAGLAPVGALAEAAGAVEAEELRLDEEVRRDQSTGGGGDSGEAIDRGDAGIKGLSKVESSHETVAAGADVTDIKEAAGHGFELNVHRPLLDVGGLEERINERVVFGRERAGGREGGTVEATPGGGSSSGVAEDGDVERNLEGIDVELGIRIGHIDWGRDVLIDEERGGELEVGLDGAGGAFVEDAVAGADDELRG